MSGEFFREVPSCSTEDLLQLTRAACVGGYLLLDVRQPEEYERGHLPGAELVPLGELPDRIAELPRDRTVVVYCRTGQRSAAATILLRDHGHPHAVNLVGGILAYRGAVVGSRPELAGPVFDVSRTAAENAAIAWQLERATAELYASEAAARASEASTAMLLERLARSEVAHQALLEDLVPRVDAGATGPLWPHSVRVLEPRLIEGGIPLGEAQEWARTASDRELFELAASFEAVAFDRYAVLARRARGKASRRVFEALANAEREHLAWLVEAIGDGL